MVSLRHGWQAAVKEGPAPGAAESLRAYDQAAASRPWFSFYKTRASAPGASDATALDLFRVVPGAAPAAIYFDGGLTYAELSSELRQYERRCWRLVEAQHQVSTLKWVDTMEAQSALEDLIEETKPAIPIECRHLDHLLSAAFRYGAGGASA